MVTAGQLYSAEDVCKANDAFRSSLFRIGASLPEGMAVATAGLMNVLDAAKDSMATILKQVAEYAQFPDDNDPYAEHDFGAFHYRSPGEATPGGGIGHSYYKCYWKIDYYENNRCEMGGDQYRQKVFRVMTIMLAEDY